MGAVMIRCPQTGHGIPTGYEAEPAHFREMPVFFAVSYCPICRTDHHWFARDAWVRKQPADANQGRQAAWLAPVWPGTGTPGEEDRDATRERGTR
jgi:hypothetical protein